MIGSVVFFVIFGIWALFFAGSGSDQDRTQDTGTTAVTTTSDTLKSTTSPLGTGSWLFAPEGLGASVRVPSSWVEAEPRLGVDFAVEDPTEGGGFVLATRVLALGGHEYRDVLQERLVESGATIHSVDTSMIDDHPTQIFHYELAVQRCCPAQTELDTEYAIDGGDGTYILVVVGEPKPAQNNDLLAAIGSTIAIGDLDLPVDIEGVSLEESGFLGAFSVPREKVHRTAVLLLGGSEGGMPDGGFQLARAGFPTLSLAYFKAPGLPDQLAEIPLEYFETALRWLADRPGVDPERIFIWGWSRGGEAALLIAATYPDLVHGVIANVPANVVVGAFPSGGPAWALGGEPIPYAEIFPHLDVIHEPDAEIPVEQIAGPILLTCGGEDTVWASCPMSHAIIDRLERLEHPYQRQLLEYPDIGHLVNRPPPWGSANVRIGGDAAWRASLAFLDDNS